jgi:hypothetical protein
MSTLLTVEKCTCLVGTRLAFVFNRLLIELGSTMMGKRSQAGELNTMYRMHFHSRRAALGVPHQRHCIEGAPRIGKYEGLNLNPNHELGQRITMRQTWGATDRFANVRSSEFAHAALIAGTSSHRKEASGGQPSDCKRERAASKHLRKQPS